jgi:hypothetical protein
MKNKRCAEYVLSDMSDVSEKIALVRLNFCALTEICGLRPRNESK